MSRMLLKAVALSLAGALSGVFTLAQEPAPPAAPQPAPPAAAQPAQPAAPQVAEADALPPNMKPGECYVKVQQPAKFESSEERVLVKPEAIRYEIIPAEFKDVEKEVITKPETISYEIVPAQFETKEVEVAAAPDFTSLTATEPEFQSEDATVITRPARVAVKLGENVLNPQAHMTGEVLCLVNEDAESQTYVRHLLIKPAQWKQEKVAKAVEKVATQVLVKAAEVKEIKVPAELKKIMVKELVRPASKKEVKIPAEYTTITKHRLLEPEKIVWQRVLCATNVTPEVVKNIQSKLKEQGIDCGEVNGDLNEPTKAAILQYQTQHKIAQAGLTYEFLEHIGLKPGS